MRCKSLFSLLIVAFGLFCQVNSVFAQEASAEPAAAAAPVDGGEKKLDIGEIIFGHVGDSHEWHFFEIGEKPVAIPLPIILYTKDGIKMMSAGHFEEWSKDPVTNVVRSNSHEGVHIEKGMKEKVVADDGSEIYDLSITKNVLSLLISVVLLLWIGFSVAKKYKQGGATKAPSGFQNALETAILFIRDEVAIPNLGKSKHGRYMPLLLTLFFFIWINNLLGLLPGGANLTGNIAVTLCLSIISFLVMVGSANKHFWGHLLNPPGVPFFVKLVLVPIEIISLFIKPVALTIRLFANILAGHIIILCVISIIFIFAGLNKFAGAGFAPISIAFSIFMFMLELLVAAIQAFIFTNLTSVFIGSAIEEAHHHDDDHAHEPDNIEIMM